MRVAIAVLANVSAIALPASLSAQCVLREGVYATPITASVETTTPFALTITNTSITTTLRDAHNASFAVLGGLRFVAEGDATQLAHMTHASVDFGDAVRATAGVPVRVERVRGDGAFVTLTDAAWLGVRATHRRVRCADLGPQMHPASMNGRDHGSWSIDGIVRLRRTPRGRTFFSMPTADGFVLRLLESEGEWTRVAIAHASGFGEVSIAGWVHEGSPLGGFGGRSAHVPRPPPPEPALGEYVAIARIAEGIPIRATPNGEAWATTTDEREWQVRLEPGSAWGQLVYIPGVDDGNERFEHAWIPRSEAQLELTHFAPPLPYPID